MPAVPVDLDVARFHARLGAELASRGTAIGPHDLTIAATALSIDYTVATRDLRNLPRISGVSLKKL